MNGKLYWDTADVRRMTLKRWSNDKLIDRIIHLEEALRAVQRAADIQAETTKLVDQVTKGLM